VKNTLLATESRDKCVLLVSSDPKNWDRGAVVLKRGHTREVLDVNFSFTGRETVCSIGDDIVGRVWRDGSSCNGESYDQSEKMGCGWGWVG